MLSINRDVVKYQILGLSILISEHIVVINYVSAIFLLIGFVSLYLSGRYRDSLYIILLPSALSLSGINLYTLGFGGINLFYIGIVTLVFYSLIFKLNEHSRVSKIAFYYSLLAFVYSVLSFGNLISSPSYYVKDFIIIAFVPIAIYLLYKRLNEKDFVFLIYNLILVKILTSLFFYTTGFTGYNEIDLKGAFVVDNADELGAFYSSALLSIFLFSKSSQKTIIRLAFSIAVFGIGTLGLGFLTLGSQVLLMLLLIFG